MTLGVAGVLAYMAWRMMPLAADALQTLPTIDQLRRVEGNVTTWWPCHSAGRNKLVEKVTLEEPGRREDVVLPCIMPKGMALVGTHRMTVLLQELPSVGPVVYDVSYDGRQLLAYDDVRRQRERRLPFLVGVIVLALAIVGALLVWLVRQCLHALRR